MATIFAEFHSNSSEVFDTTATHGQSLSKLTTTKPTSTDIAPRTESTEDSCMFPRIQSETNASGMVSPSPTVATVADVNMTALAHR